MVIMRSTKNSGVRNPINTIFECNKGTVISKNANSIVSDPL